MMKAEFEDLIQERISSDDYRIIETVYNYHPALNEFGAKQRIADIYQEYGMGLILDMYPTAAKMRNYEQKINLLRSQLRELEEERADYYEKRGMR